MSPRLLVLVAICALAPEAVRAQGGKGGKGVKEKETEEQRQAEEVQRLVRELRDLPSQSPGGIARPGDQKRLLERIAKINHPQAVRQLIGYLDNPDYGQLREELLGILARIRTGDDQISRVMREHMAVDDPCRRIARKYLLDQARSRRQSEWLDGLFTAAGTVEDKFLALQVLGEISAGNALDCATVLANDKSWRPDADGLVSCGTIAMAVEGAEGPQAACLLLGLMKDSRFGPADAAKVREATRLWHESDLRAYLDLKELADRNPLKRQEAATLLGAVGLEAARAPLVRVATNKREPPEVRAAATAALGGLRIAKEDLAEILSELASDKDPLVRGAARDGLGRLMVRRSAVALVSMLDGPWKEEAKAALSRLTGLPPETDWKAWLATANLPGDEEHK